MWDRTAVECVQSQELPWQPAPRGEFGAGGGVRRVLSVDPSAGAATTLVRLSSRQRGALVAGADLYLLAGEGLVNGEPYGPHHYLFVPPGAHLDLAPVGGPTTVLAGAFGPADLVEGVPGPSTVTHVDVDQLDWSAPDWAGSGPGSAVKWLRRDERGVAFLSAKLPGWRSGQEERHPQAEESFRISGDLFVGTPGVTTAGSSFFHRPGQWHGPLYTRCGTSAFVRADAPISTEYRTPVTTVDLSRAYLTHSHPALT